jgi:large subunit ribosomal protein L23
MEEQSNMSELTLIPHISEKAYATSLSGVYVFVVPTTANKAEVTKAVQSKYGVTVENVNLLNRKGKKARSIRLGSKKQPIYGKRSDSKKAYVTVKKGDIIQIEAFSEVQEVESPKADKKGAKK